MKPYHKNPRQIKRKQFEQLQSWLREFGDLSGIVHDLTSDEIISGNQRNRAIDISSCTIEIVDGPHPPDAQGTVAHGYVIWNDARYNYRQVRWTPRQCEQANIIANRAGGDWDWDILANQFTEEDLLAWGFEEFDFTAISDPEPAAAGEGAAELECPACGHHFTIQ